MKYFIFLFSIFILLVSCTEVKESDHNWLAEIRLNNSQLLSIDIESKWKIQAVNFGHKACFVSDYSGKEFGKDTICFEPFNLNFYLDGIHTTGDQVELSYVHNIFSKKREVPHKGKPLRTRVFLDAQGKVNDIEGGRLLNVGNQDYLDALEKGERVLREFIKSGEAPDWLTELRDQFDAIR